MKLSACLLSGFAFAGCGPQPTPQESPAPASRPADPLPEGAVARLDTMRENRKMVVRTVAFSPDGKVLAAAADDITLWELATGKEIRRLPGRVAVAFSPDGKLLACGDRNHTLRLHEAATGRELRRFQASRAGVTFPAAVAFSPDSKLVTAETPHLIGLWEVATGLESPLLNREALFRSLDTIPAGLNALAFSPDGRVLVGAPENRLLFLWRMAPRTAYRTFPQESVKSVAFSPDGKWLATAGGLDLRRRERFRLYLWEVETHEPYRRMAEDLDDLRAVAYSPDGRSLASGGGDGLVRLWEVATGKERHAFRGHREAVWCVAFSLDGRTLASGSQDGTVLLWDAHGATSRAGDVAGRQRAGQSPNSLTPEQLEALWTDLGDLDAARAFQAVCTLRCAPEQAVPFLKDRLLKETLPDSRRMARLVADLDANQFGVREKATAELEALGPLAEPALRKAIEQQPSAEVRRRAGRLLDALRQSPFPAEGLRGPRALEVLELLGTPEARAALQALADGAAEAWLKREAGASLGRLQSLRHPHP